MLLASHVMHLPITPCTKLDVTLPNGSIITSTHVGKLPLSDTQCSSTFYVFSDADLKQSLLSFSALCNEHNCVVTLTKTDVSICRGTTLMFHGTKLPNDTLWHINLDQLMSPLTSGSCNNAFKTETDAEFAFIAVFLLFMYRHRTQISGP